MMSKLLRSFVLPLAAAVAALVATAASYSSPQPAGDAGVASSSDRAGRTTPDDGALTRLLAGIKAQDTGQLAVSEEDGRFLRLMIATSGAKRALEIGGASGYSAIWMGQALRTTGGRLVTIEYDPVRARELGENIRRAGLTDIVSVVAGDAFERTPQLEGTFDFVFLDAIGTHPALWTTVVSPSGEGISISMKLK